MQTSDSGSWANALRPVASPLIAWPTLVVISKSRLYSLPNTLRLKFLFSLFISVWLAVSPHWPHCFGGRTTANNLERSGNCMDSMNGAEKCHWRSTRPFGLLRFGSFVQLVERLFRSSQTSRTNHEFLPRWLTGTSYLWSTSDYWLSPAC